MVVYQRIPPWSTGRTLVASRAGEHTAKTVTKQKGHQQSEMEKSLVESAALGDFHRI